MARSLPAMATEKGTDLAFKPHSFMLSSLVAELSSFNPDKKRSYPSHLGELLKDMGFAPVSQRGATALPTRYFVRELAGREASRRDLNASTASQGGDLVFGRMSDVAEAARPQNALDAAGVPRLELLASGPVSFPRWVKETSLGGWVAEGGTAGAPNLTVAEVTAMPRSAFASLRITRRLRIQTAFDLEQSLLRELAAANRATLEDGFLNGDGTESKPLGLLNIPTATTNTWAGATPTRAELVEQLQHYTEAFGRIDQARWLANSDLIGRMLCSEVASQTGIFNLTIEGAQPTVMGIPVVLSEAMPDDRLLLINPQTIRLVYWGAPAAIVDRTTYATQGDSVLYCYNDADIISLYPAQVCIGKAAAA